jgi:hypothetical protein
LHCKQCKERLWAWAPAPVRREACPLVGLALMRLRIRARVAFEPL